MLGQGGADGLPGSPAPAAAGALLRLQQRREGGAAGAAGAASHTGTPGNAVANDADAAARSSRSLAAARHDDSSGGTTSSLPLGTSSTAQHDTGHTSGDGTAGEHRSNDGGGRSRSRAGEAVTPFRRLALGSFYVWLNAQNLVCASAVWALCADAFSPAAGGRIFGFLSAGGSGLQVGWWCLLRPERHVCARGGCGMPGWSSVNQHGTRGAHWQFRRQQSTGPRRHRLAAASHPTHTATPTQ